VIAARRRAARIAKNEVGRADVLRERGEAQEVDAARRFGAAFRDVTRRDGRVQLLLDVRDVRGHVGQRAGRSLIGVGVRVADGAAPGVAVRVTVGTGVGVWVAGGDGVAVRVGFTRVGSGSRS
jgi:hypothetical protein